MRKMRRNNLMFNKAVMSKVAASAVAAAAVAIPMAAPLMAANAYDTNKQEFANNLSAPKMNKYLIMKRDANVPNVTFDFTITTTGVEPIPATSTTLAVYKGDDATKVSGQPVLSNNGAVTFGPSDSVYTTYQNLDNDLGGSVTGRTDSTMLAGKYDGFTSSGIDNTKQYARKAVEIDFSGVRFSEPGVYRWKINETTTDNTPYDVKDDNGKYLDVYVEHKDGTTDTLVVTGYVLHDGNPAPAISGGTPVPSSNTKDGGFVNEYFTQDLTFGKQVTGNQGSKDKYFEFTLNLEGAAAGDKFKVDITDADASIAANPNGATTKISSAVTNPTELTADANGKIVNQKFYLQADQSIVIKNLSRGITYTLTEDKEDYVQTAASASTPVAYNRATGTWNAGDKSATDPASGTIASADINTGFKNNREGTIPTGIMYTVFPGAVAVLFGGAGAAFVMKRRKEN